MTAPSRSHGHTQAHWDRMCASKVRYPDEATCRARMGQLFEQGHVQKKRLWVYKCPSCRGFHMTSASQYGDGSFRTPVTANDLYTETK